MIFQFCLPVISFYFYILPLFHPTLPPVVYNRCFFPTSLKIFTVTLDIYTYIYVYIHIHTSLVAQTAIQGTQVWYLSQEDPLEKRIVTYSSNLAWRILWTEEPGGLQSMGLPRVGHNLAIKPPPPILHYLMCHSLFIRVIFQKHKSDCSSLYLKSSSSFPVDKK